MRFVTDKDMMDALVHLMEKSGAGERGKAIVVEPALVTSHWGMLYGDDTGVVP